MIYFLEKIAQSLSSEFGNTLNRHCLVFPNRRAGLYFLKYLAASIDKPVWTPSILTINELFRSYSSLQIAGPEILLFELYKVYHEIRKSAESFDEFYFWGDMLLDDFDDVDKYLVNSSLLFRNVQDIRIIDQQFGSLTEEQVAIIKRFWINFNPDRLTTEKSDFISIWSVLNDLYSEFRNSLRDQNLAYEGMVFRELAEKPLIDYALDTKWDMIHFIGFNALNECEKTVMSGYKKADKARFYWDYDSSYMREDKLNSAGYFLKDNLKIFGNDMPLDWSFDTTISSQSQKVLHRVIDASSDIAQVKLISQLIDELPDLTSGNSHHTAIILADENLLMPVLSSLPENMGDINITMGHPLRQTIVYTLVKHLIDLQRTATINDDVVWFNHKVVIGILKHTLLEELMNESDNELINEIVRNNLIWVPADRFSKSEHLCRIFIKPGTPEVLSDYFKDVLSILALNDETNHDNSNDNLVQRNIRNEFIYRIVLSINRLETIVKRPGVSFTTDTYMRILDRMLKSQAIPFSGEPLSGIQIMGILESRALDFKNIIILSVNEGILPTISSGSSFIPYTLREAFGLPSVNHQESIYAYHFFRLLQRAENVVFTYNSNSDGLRSGEMSRFLIQMKYDDIKPDFRDLSFEIKTQGSFSDSIERTDDHMKRLKSQFFDNNAGRILSPSAINTWLNCRMKFFYRYVNGLKEKEKVSGDIDPAMLGNILHDILNNIYQKYKGKALSVEFFKSMIINKKLLSEIINDAINENLKHGRANSITGNELIVRDVLMEYLNRILYADMTIAPLTILNLEDSFKFKLSVNPNETKVDISVGGKIDRIDLVNGITRIVDYKTGAVTDVIKSVDDIFTDDRDKDIDGWLQTLLYCEAYLANMPATVIRPSVYSIRKLKGDLQSEKLRIKTDSKNDVPIEDYNLIRSEFVSGLKEIINRIFSDDEPFIMTKDIRRKCSYCPYKTLCMR